ncbi:nucleoside-diphosphate sugar epimerase/dehydratase [Isachenkonia alkalipeptolytica]|nr:nucleoside-diphosphate sugar epimerase/dehydratase [Isachenkonia alkalipeptolytica]
MLGDAAIINISFIIAFLLRFEGSFFISNVAQRHFEIYLSNIVTITLIKLVIYYIFGLYKNLWKYASIYEVLQIVGTTVVANTAVVSYMFLTQDPLPRSIFAIVVLLDIALIGGLRFSFRASRSLRDRMGDKGFKKKGQIKQKRSLIIGAGEAGAQVIKELRNHKELNSIPVAVIDDNDEKYGARINGVPVVGDRYHIKKVVEKYRIDEIIIAIPSMQRQEIRGVIEECNKTKCKLKIVPGLSELIDGEVSIQAIREVKIDDLLGREPVKLDMEGIQGYIKDRVVLVTGGGGSIGSELCRQIAAIQPKKLLILDNYENNAYAIQNEIRSTYPEVDLFTIIASVREKERMDEIFATHKPQVVFHAAAHKHVPLMEDNPQEAVKNNIFGTRNVAECADKYGTERFVLISTDKAVNPTNIMGASKRVAEMVIQALDKESNTEFIAVRFGNVLGSNGSVIPLFKEQIEKGGPVTVTHEEVTRYFMTIPEAVQLVVQTGSMAKGGEIFVLDMGEPVKIIDLARNLIRLSGFEPDVDIEIKVVGLRPGEKLYEELLLDGEGLEDTCHEKIFVGKPMYTDFKFLQRELDILWETLDKDGGEIKGYMGKIVPTYKQTAN